MFRRTLAVISVLGMVGFSGCCSAPESFGPTPPAFKLCNGSRLLDEVSWLYADLQDTIFGVDYYYDLNFEYGDGPYK